MVIAGHLHLNTKMGTRADGGICLRLIEDMISLLARLLISTAHFDGSTWCHVLHTTNWVTTEVVCTKALCTAATHFGLQKTFSFSNWSWSASLRQLPQRL